MSGETSYSPINSDILSFPAFSLSFLASPSILMVLLAFFFVFYCIISAILMYHWSAYGMRNPGILIAESLFVLISLVLFMVASLSLSYI